MNVWARKQGYTIVEVMIVLAVTGSLLASALYFMNGRSRRLAFENDITAFRTKIDDVINNVSSGYYATSSNFSCSSSANGPSITTDSSARGTNAGCQLLGRGVHLSINFANSFYVHNIIGLRKTSDGSKLATSMADAQPKLLSNGTADTVETAEQILLNSSELVNTRITKTDNTNVSERGFLGFISSFPTVNVAGNINPGSQAVGLYTVYDSTLPQYINLGQTKIQAVDWFNSSFDAAKVIEIKKFEVCFNSLGSDQYAIITVGQDGSRTNTSQTIASGSCPVW